MREFLSLVFNLMFESLLLFLYGTPHRVPGRPQKSGSILKVADGHLCLNPP